MNVTARDMSSGRSNFIQIKNEKGRLSQEEIERMLNEAEKFKRDDDRQRDRINARNRLDNLVSSLKEAVEDPGATRSLSQADKTFVLNICEKEFQWLSANTNADKEELELRFSELCRKCQAIMIKLHTTGQKSGSIL